MLDIVTTLKKHFGLTDAKLKGLRYSDENISLKKENIIIQAVNLHTAAMIKEGIKNVEEIYVSFPFDNMVSSLVEFKEILRTQSENIVIEDNRVGIFKIWFGDLIEKYEPRTEIEEIVLKERLCNVAVLKDVGEICGLTPESVRQKELNIQSSIMNGNIGRVYMPELFFYDCKYTDLFDKFVFPYTLYIDLCKESPRFNSVRRYYHYVLKKNVKTDSKLPLTDRYVKAFTEVKDILEALDSTYSPDKYRIYEEVDEFGNSIFHPLNSRTILFAAMKAIGKPVHPKELYSIYNDFVRTNNYSAEYEKPANYFDWNIMLLKNILKTDDRKIRFYDYKKYEHRFDEIFSLLEREFENSYRDINKQKFLIRDTSIEKFKDILAEIDIYGEVELHSLIRSFYKGDKFSLGRCPVIYWGKK